MTEWNVPTMIGRMAWANKRNKNHRFVLQNSLWVRVCDWSTWWNGSDFTEQDDDDLDCKVCMAVKPRELL